MICYCKREIAEGDRKLTLGVAVDWGDNDERHPQDEKQIVFHSFKCISDWATDRAFDHDGRTVFSPEESLEPANPLVDSQTDSVIR